MSFSHVRRWLLGSAREVLGKCSGSAREVEHVLDVLLLKIDDANCEFSTRSESLCVVSGGGKVTFWTLK